MVLSPDWAEGLIIYEVATKAFTSPHGPGSGTFRSLEGRLGYLAGLGINAIWLSGHQLCDAGHFYGIWNQYACIRPDRIDPSLGTPEDFKGMIEAAHRLGIRVFLDVITHGVMSNSPLIVEKPHWFKEGSWGMTDYDWYGGHGDLDDWWVNTWLGYVKDFGVDGFRLDVAAYRYDLWSRIRSKAHALDHDILVIHENYPSAAGATDFLQSVYRLSSPRFLNRSHGLLNDAARFLQKAALRQNVSYRVAIKMKDSATVEGETGGEGTLRVTYEGDEKRQVGTTWPYIDQRGLLRVENVPTDGEIDDIVITDSTADDPDEHHWVEKPQAFTNDVVIHERELVRTGEAPSLLLSFPLPQQDGQCLSIQLSCHDNGWPGFPMGQNPYAAQGSRFAFGYGFMLASAVPVFMSGEEFDADFVPLPDLSPAFFGGGEVGRGMWLYGSWLQWEQAESPKGHAMLADVKRLIRIRKSEARLIRPFRLGEPVQTLAGVEYRCEARLPVPYMYYDRDELLLVAGNPDEKDDMGVRFRLPEDAVKKFGRLGSFAVDDLWNERKVGEMTLQTFEKTEWPIRRDRTGGGGLLVLRLSRGQREKIGNPSGS